MTNDLDLAAVTALLPAGSAAWLRARPGSVRRIQVGAGYYYAFTTPEGDERTIAIDQVVGFEPTDAIQPATQPEELPSWGTATTAVDKQRHHAAIEAEESERKRVGEAEAAQARFAQYKAVTDNQAALQRHGDEESERAERDRKLAEEAARRPRGQQGQ
jgi:hypothetical protein